MAEEEPRFESGANGSLCLEVVNEERARGFKMLQVHPTGGAGCVESVLRRDR
ncbi:MAG: hypothetical protein NTZ61_04755 [Proteobacteria bacterium]|nr:hypothetical protein [Pseudomonadota bacterium]